MSDRIVVIGGSGFIGSHLVNRLLEVGHEVRIADSKRSDQHPELWVACDVRDAEQVRRACAGCDRIYNLAAEHRDDVRPISLYDRVNVDGAAHTCAAAEAAGISKIIFVSSVAVYGFSDRPLDESAEPNPFNDYGRTKLEAEGVFQKWLAADESRTLTIVRPTVVFGEDNRGNVYTLLKQIAEGPFLMIGNGRNSKSMAYVENVAAFLEFALRFDGGLHLYNYIDKPDFDMNRLVEAIHGALGTSPRPGIRIPYAIAYLAGFAFDGLAAVLRRPLPVSRVRIQKFCSASVFSAEKARATGFVPPVELTDALALTISHEFSR